MPLRTTAQCLHQQPGAVACAAALQVKRGVLYTWHEAEGKRLKNPFDTITEGVGLNRLTANFASAAVDDAVRVTDREAVEMAAYLLRWMHRLSLFCQV